MKSLALVLSVVALAACAPRNHYRTFIDKNDKPRAAASETADVRELDAKDANGSSVTSFMVSAAPGESGKTVKIPFHFNSEKYKAFTVERPYLKGICADPKKEPVIALFNDASSKKTKIYWDKGTKSEAKALNLEYDNEQPVEANSDHVITLVVKLPKDCSFINGTVAVHFAETPTKAAGK